MIRAFIILLTGGNVYKQTERGGAVDRLSQLFNDPARRALIVGLMFVALTHIYSACLLYLTFPLNREARLFSTRFPWLATYYRTLDGNDVKGKATASFES